MERAPSIDPAAAILLAHHTALGLRACDVIDPDGHPSTQLLLPAGPGAFRCDARIGADDSLRGAPSLHLFAATWIADDMLGANQVKLEAAGVPGERLGDTWLLPPPLRRGSIDASGRAQVVPFRRLPDGLAQALSPPVPSARALPEALMAQLVAIADANGWRIRWRAKWADRPVIWGMSGKLVTCVAE